MAIKFASAKYILIGVGAVAGAVLIGKALRNSKPLMVGLAKEGIAFGQWFSSNVAEGQEFVDDVVAEAKHEYRKEVEAKLEMLQKQQEILMKIKDAMPEEEK